MKGRCFRMSYTLLVNKSHPLTSSYVPPCLAEAHIPFDTSAHDEKTLMEKTAAKAAARLFHQAASDNITLMGVSGYRSYKRQESLYRNALARSSSAVAPPGTSEHQTGLALDISCASLNFELEEAFPSENGCQNQNVPGSFSLYEPNAHTGSLGHSFCCPSCRCCENNLTACLLIC